MHSTLLPSTANLLALTVGRHLLRKEGNGELADFWRAMRVLYDTGWQPSEYTNLLQFAYQSTKWHDRYDWQIVGDYSHPLRAADDFNSSCTTSRIANFLFAVSPGQFLGCNGWDPQFAYPLGEPLGPANTSAAGVTTRHFASGTHVTYDASTNEYQIFWAGQPLPPPSPGPAPSPSR